MKKKMTAETEFPRSWAQEMDNGLVYDFIAQPYISGLYIAGKCRLNQSNVQLGQTWESLPRFLNSLKNNKMVTELNMKPLGVYMTKNELTYLP